MTPVRRAVLTASRPRLQLGLLLLLAAAAGCPQSAPDKEAPAPSPPSTSTATAALTSVRFESEPRRPGSHFTIVVDVSNGKVADFIPGR